MKNQHPVVQLLEEFKGQLDNFRARVTNSKVSEPSNNLLSAVDALEQALQREINNRNGSRPNDPNL